MPTECKVGSSTSTRKSLISRVGRSGSCVWSGRALLRVQVINCRRGYGGAMAERSPSPVSMRFGLFEVSSESGELRKNGVRLKLSGQAIQVLLTLLEIPGRL